MILLCCHTLVISSFHCCLCMHHVALLCDSGTVTEAVLQTAAFWLSSLLLGVCLSTKYTKLQRCKNGCVDAGGGKLKSWLKAIKKK